MSAAAAVPCPRCEAPMEAATVKSAIWREGRVFLLEDIPAQVCGNCREQFYDEPTTEALRRFTEENFASLQPVREMTVPVYSLAGHISYPENNATNDDETYADY